MILESRSLRPWRWTAAGSRLSQSNRRMIAAGAELRNRWSWTRARAAAVLGYCWSTLRASIERGSLEALPTDRAGSAIDWRKPRKSDRVASNRRTPNGSNGAFGSTGHRTVVCSFARTPVSRVSMIIRSALPWTSASKIVPLSLHRTIVAFWGEPVEALVGSPGLTITCALPNAREKGRGGR